MLKVVNIIPQSLSGETRQDSEPNIAVNPANPQQIAISAFTPDPLGGPNAPIFVSADGGNNWTLNTIVPSNGATTGTGDITVRFATQNNRFYAGILKLPGSLLLNILRTGNFAGAAVMTALVSRAQVDQPYIQAATVPSGTSAGKDRVYVGLNDFGAAGGKTATVELSLDAGAAAPSFTKVRVEKRATSGQNGPQVRTAVALDGTVYAIFYGWRSFLSSVVTADVTVVRDDNWGSGATPFTALTDPSDSLAGRKVATGVTFTWSAILAQERLGGDLSIAVDPANSSNVYIAYCDVQSGNYTLHVRRSTNRGVTWSADIKTISRAKNPALAINSAGTVGLAYQGVTGSGASQRWETHLLLTSDAFVTVQDLTLATVPSATPAATFLPYMGDYIHMMAVDKDFYGVFSTSNVPDLANFPQGVTYLRNHNFTTKQLLAVNGTTVVQPSIDPFYFHHFTPLVTTFTKLTALTKLTIFTKFTPLTTFTSLTKLTSLTSLTSLTKLTLFTKFTSLTKFTLFTPFTIPQITSFVPPGGPVEIDPRPFEGTAPVQPFIRFGNTIFTPEELDLHRFEPLSDVVDELGAIGVTRLHQLAVYDPYLLSLQLRWSREDAARLIDLSQSLLRSLVQ